MNTLLAVLLGTIAALLGVALYAAVAMGRRILRDDGRLRLVEAVHGRGLALPGPENETCVHDAALAVRRCVACAAHERCDVLLAARDWNGLRAICPNSAYIELLAAPSR